ncbi:NAD-dependent epimerase/dehydratase family protein [Microlunatus elymi]|uniref:NAD-dependent epimerase/dehydratase family protein n=1 Tax=Microlunatus elymi TaxID=2596828 RepID=A0A516PZD7_9ACTN|nr:NAD(P)H-binding protein [Microlunatus elymi]QDP96543.1 NAD-dependent epimerase/dehydratase family protein [Microlunatus elymi]
MARIGAIGLPVLQRLIAAGHQVAAIHHNPAGAQRLRESGAEPIQVDVLDRSALLAGLDHHRYDVVISELTALKKAPTRHSDMAMTNRLRIDGTANLLAAAAQTGATRFVSQSMVFGYGYGDFGGRVLTEDDQFGPPGHGRFEDHLAAMRSAEARVLGSTRCKESPCGTDCSTVPVRPATRSCRACDAGGCRSFDTAAYCRGSTSTTQPTRPWPPWNVDPVRTTSPTTNR